jgi:orotate phosphoribosyltransferase-like protein
MATKEIQERTKNIIALWEEGGSVEEIAEKLSINHNVVRYTLNNNGYDYCDIPKNDSYRADFKYKWDIARGRLLGKLV